ncbi:MAG: toll/interleukin-1 receptor domain-containing protein [Verrucomicrobiota bacterium]
MLYDVFICHASADKADFVRPLVEALRDQHVEVWYDEKSLKLGDSLRRAIDKGLTKSRFGVVVLSKAFFARNWPQYELDALAEREMAGNDKVLLPVWHGVTHQDVLAYSPALAGRKAVSSSEGLAKVVGEILSVIHPQESPLIVARDYLLEWGITPPVITDQYWLDVVEASNRVPGFGAVVPEESSWRRWSFPLPPKEGDSRSWGERLAWTAMQLNWVKAAETIPITPLTPRKEVLKFIHCYPGLFETCSTFPALLAEYAPQLTIPGFGGGLESRLEEEFKKSPGDEEWTLRRPDFAEDPEMATYSYFHGGIFGPDVSPYEDADHGFWLLSSASSWLPARVRSVLLDGMKHYHTWLWHSPSGGALSEALFAAKQRRFKWNSAIEGDVRDRIQKTITLLRLSDSEEYLFKCFRDERNRGAGR